MITTVWRANEYGSNTIIKIMAAIHHIRSHRGQTRRPTLSPILNAVEKTASERRDTDFLLHFVKNLVGGKIQLIYKKSPFIEGENL